MNILSANVLTLLLLCVTGSALQAMENDETVLTFTNKIPQTAKVAIACKGRDDLGGFRIDIRSCDLEPNQTIELTMADVPQGLKFGKSLMLTHITAYDVQARFNNEYVSYVAYLRNKLTLIFDDITGKYKIET